MVTMQVRLVCMLCQCTSLPMPAQPWLAWDALVPVCAHAPPCTLQADSRAQPLPPGPGREVSFEEKRKLSLAISGMAHDKLTIVMDLVSQDPAMDLQQVIWVGARWDCAISHSPNLPAGQAVAKGTTMCVTFQR